MKNNTKDRLFLRELNKKDATSLVSIFNYREVAEMSTLRYPFTEKMAQEMIFKSRISANTSQIILGITLKGTDQLVGAVSLKDISQQHRKAEISLWIGKDYWNLGYGFEALRKLIDFGFKRLKLVKLYADIREPNIGSLKLFLKSGFTLEGRMRKHVCYGGPRMDLLKVGLLIDDLKTGSKIEEDAK
jgi:[ribosomal protein S5]-alanine N-acetyltransferase